MSMEENIQKSIFQGSVKVDVSDLAQVLCYPRTLKYFSIRFNEYPLKSVSRFHISTFSTNRCMSSKTAWPILPKFHFKQQWVGDVGEGKKVCLNGSSWLNKMADMPTNFIKPLKT